MAAAAILIINFHLHSRYRFQPPVVLALVLPLAAYVDQLLNEAILACDPDKAEKDAAKAAKKKQKTVDEKPV